MVPKRPPGAYTGVPSAARKSGTIPYSGTQSFDVAKSRVLAKLEDRLDLSASKRMPPALLRQSIRQLAEQIAEQEARGLAKAERERLVEEVLAEFLGYGPLEELFRDTTVREVMVAGPHAVIARREMGTWAPTNIRFRDEEHLRSALDRLATHADAVGGVTASVNLFDLKLPNGFRAVGVVPPPGLGQSALVSFLRVETIPNPANATLTGSGSHPALSVTGSSSMGFPVPGSIRASPRPGSGSVQTPPARVMPLIENDPILKHRNRIIERLIKKLASLGVYDLQRVDVTELRRVVAAYVIEYLAAEKLYLSDTDQGRLQLEILTAMHR
jgi:pilus assembly protein CpaF